MSNDQPKSHALTYQNKYYTLVKTGIDEQIYNNVFNNTCEEPSTLITELRNIKQSIQLALTAWITAETDNDELIEKKLKTTFISPGSFYGMALDLRNVNIPSTISEYNIQQVTNEEQAEIFADVHCEIFNFPGLHQRKSEWARNQLKLSSPDAIG